MNAIKTLAYSAVAASAAVSSNAFAAIVAEGGTGKVNETLKGRGDQTLESSVQGIISFITNLLYLIAVAYALYGGFLILTSGGDEEKVKKGKTILMHGAIGLLVIFLASSIVSFILRAVVAV